MHTFINRYELQRKMQFKQNCDGINSEVMLQLCVTMMSCRRACGHVDVGTCPHQVLATTLTLLIYDVSLT